MGIAKLKCRDDTIIDFDEDLIKFSGFLTIAQEMGEMLEDDDDSGAFMAPPGATCDQMKDILEFATVLFLNPPALPAYEQRMKEQWKKDPRTIFNYMNAQDALEFRSIIPGERGGQAIQLYNPFENNDKAKDLTEYFFNISAEINEKVLEAGASDDIFMNILGISPDDKPTEQELLQFLKNVDKEIKVRQERANAQAEEKAQAEVRAAEENMKSLKI